MSKDGTAALSSSIMDEISQGIGSVNISGNGGIAAAMACDMSSSREEDMNSEKKCTSDQKLVSVKTNVGDNTSGGDKSVSICANCGKEGATNTCNKCMMVKYCNAVCKKRHRHKHKKDCEEHLKHLAKLQEEENKRAVELYDIELFKEPPISEEECPICFQRLPTLRSGSRHKACCGKIICSGCIYAVQIRDEEALCPFCRVPSPSSDKIIIERLLKRVEVNDGEAIHNLGDYYNDGDYGLTQDHTKALELWHRAAELDSTPSYFSIGCMYYNGRGVERDMNKARHYYELGAMRGSVKSRYNLGLMEAKAGNMERALRHFMIAVGRGHNHSLQAIQAYYSRELATKDVYAEALRAYQKYLSEVKSTQRDEAAAAREDCKYID